VEATDNVLMIFLKYPEAGKVKTRLASSIGEKLAAFYYKGFVETVIKNTRSFNYTRQIIFTPRQKGKEISEWLGTNEKYFAQEGLCLGARQANAFKEAFKAGARKVVVIGTDNPLIDNDMINQAMQFLENNDLVIGPSVDGGYYLLGMKEFNEKIFEKIDWSTDKVFEQVLRNASDIGMSVGVLKESFDVDTLDDLTLLKEKYGYVI